MPAELESIVLSHVAADGPVSFPNILAYARQQWQGDCQDYLLAICLNTLLHDRRIVLYDDGVSFIIFNRCQWCQTSSIEKDCRCKYCGLNYDGIDRDGNRRQYC